MASQPEGSASSALRRWMAPSPDHPRFSTLWWLLWTIRFVVFGITGSSSVYFVRPVMKATLGIDGTCLHRSVTGSLALSPLQLPAAPVHVAACRAGTMMEGPWSYRIASIVCVTPVYTVILLLVGTAAGQHAFFLTVAQRMWSRILPGLVKAPAKSKPPSSSQ